MNARDQDHISRLNGEQESDERLLKHTSKSLLIYIPVG